MMIFKPRNKQSGKNLLIRTVKAWANRLKGFDKKGFKKAFRWTHGLAASFLVLIVLASFYFEIKVNVSRSLPHYLYLVQKKSTPLKGAFVAFYHPLFAGLLIKRVEGVSGDQIEIRANNVYVGNRHICPLVDRNAQREVLRPIQYKAIPKGYYFVAGDHRKSFDSCYEAFGLVHQSQVEGRAWAIF